jgi:hypothetical protein
LNRARYKNTRLVPLAGLEPARCFHQLILSHTLNDCQEVADIVDRGLDYEQWAAIVLIDRKAQPIKRFLPICSTFVGLAGR